MDRKKHHLDYEHQGALSREKLAEVSAYFFTLLVHMVRAGVQVSGLCW